MRDVISAEMWEAVNTTHLALSAGDLEGRMQMGPYSVFQYVKERSALFWGLTVADDAARRGARVPRRGRPDRVGRHGPADAARRDAGPRTTRRRGVRDGQALALLQAVGGFQAFRRAVPAPPNAGPVARFLLYERAYPDSRGGVGRRGPRRAAGRRRGAALLRAGAAPQPRWPPTSSSAAAPRPRTATSRRPAALVQSELALVDADIAERYFAGAGAAAGTVVA